MSKKTEICCKYDKRRSTLRSNNNGGIKNKDERSNEIVEIMKPAPFWSGTAIKDSKIETISLDDYRDNYLVLIFYPYDFTIVCPTELLQFSDRVEEFEALDCKIVAVSTDSEFVHLAWSTTPRKNGGLGETSLTMLSDKTHEISKSYGVYDSAIGICHRALFVIDDKSLVRHSTINDIRIPRSVDEVLRVIEASKFIDKHGDICPLGPMNENSETSFEKTSDKFFHTDLIKNS